MSYPHFCSRRGPATGSPLQGSKKSLTSSNLPTLPFCATSGVGTFGRRTRSRAADRHSLHDPHCTPGSAGSEAPLRFALTRTEVHVRTVLSEYLGNGLGYVRLSSFAESTAGELEQAARDLKAAAGDALLGVVLDLRSNPGGLLDSAVEVADAFLDGGVIVSGIGRMRKAQFEQSADAGDVLEGVPTVVLVNSQSASASEIVAGALQDHGRARIVGEKTYGKGSVQTVMPLGEGSAIKLTTSRYLTPSGRSINGTGIEPDVVVSSDDEHRQYRGANGRVALRDDAQLLEALRLISYDSITLTSVQ